MLRPACAGPPASGPALFVFSPSFFVSNKSPAVAQGRAPRTALIVAAPPGHCNHACPKREGVGSRFRRSRLPCGCSSPENDSRPRCAGVHDLSCCARAPLPRSVNTMKRELQRKRLPVWLRPVSRLQRLVAVIRTLCWYRLGIPPPGELRVSKPYDATIKDLAAVGPADFVAWFDGPTTQTVTLLNVDSVDGHDGCGCGVRDRRSAD
jgi:hypothetical protein